MLSLSKSALSLFLLCSITSPIEMQAFQSSAVTSRFLTARVPLTLMRMSSTASEKASPTVVPIHDAYDKATMDDIVSLCKRRGFIFPSSEIYNGFAGFYDYGPIGAELKKNVKDIWWKNFVTRREDVVGLDSSIIHNPITWKSSGTYD
jgi:hypothetical protein